MKRWLLAAIMLCLLTGCSTSAEIDGNTDIETTPTIIYEDDIVRASFIQMDEQQLVSGMGYFQVELQNKTDYEITVYPKDSSVDGAMVQYVSGMPATMQSGKSATQSWAFSLDTVGVSEVSEVEELAFSLWVVDENTQTILQTSILTVDVNE